MRRIKNVTIQKESFADMMTAGRHNRCLEIGFRDRHGKQIHKLDAGHSDTIHVYRNRIGVTFVLNRNRSIDYVGLQAFREKRQIGHAFLEKEHIKNIIGRMDLQPYTIIRRIWDFLCL